MPGLGEVLQACSTAINRLKQVKTPAERPFSTSCRGLCEERVTGFEPVRVSLGS